MGLRPLTMRLGLQRPGSVKLMGATNSQTCLNSYDVSLHHYKLFSPLPMNKCAHVNLGKCIVEN